MNSILRTLMIYGAGLSIALAQTTGIADQAENATVSERERLGNQRIQIEAEMRAREEQRRIEEAGSRVDMTRTLEQLRMLGELKDDGYITEDEFRKIKQKILDSRL